jgi:hypothetical protein
MIRIPALSIRQPWAWLIVNGHKPVENRNWPTKFRGALWIHAGKTKDRQEYEGVDIKCAMANIELPPIDELDYGGIVGQSYLYDCVTHSDSRWFFGEHGFLLRDSKPLPFVPCRGMLGFFNVPEDVISATETTKKGL